MSTYSYPYNTFTSCPAKQNRKKSELIQTQVVHNCN